MRFSRVATALCLASLMVGVVAAQRGGGQRGGGAGAPAAPGAAAPPMRLMTNAFIDGGAIPPKFTQAGDHAELRSAHARHGRRAEQDQ